METFRWGLTELGHQVTVQKNNAVAGSINIIFGYQMLGAPQLASLPDDTIIYNLEDVARVPLPQRKPSLTYVARRFRVWEFCESNLAAWREHQPLYPPVYVPIGYAPTLTRIPAQANPQIDALFYGYPAPPRMEILRHMCQYGIRLVFACGLYGQARDDLISHSKIVLNLNKNTEGRIFEIIRISYLLANAKPVVSDIYPDSKIDGDLKGAIAFAPREQITATCLNLLNDNAARQALGQRGLEAIRLRDIRPILSRALDAMGKREI
jgi:hypothetical protein